ncbi:MAG: hypothetical protein DRI39_10315 [Chloroflexi bacterium]|nr:MAG: hypothetical protein DRI39_10315 [Chloroflexota bacterium]
MQTDKRLFDEEGRPMGRSLDLIVQDFEDRLVGGHLTGDGVQYSTAYTTQDVGSLEEAFSRTIDPGLAGDLLWLELGLTISLYASADNTAGKWKWQGRNKDGTWVDLHDLVTESDIDTQGTGAIERTRQGFAPVIEGLGQVPLELRLMVQCDTAGRTVTARVKSSSYARAVFKSS